MWPQAIVKLLGNSRLKLIDFKIEDFKQHHQYRRGNHEDGGVCGGSMIDRMCMHSRSSTAQMQARFFLIENRTSSQQEHGNRKEGKKKDMAAAS
jgi:hypothetical protein